MEQYETNNKNDHGESMPSGAAAAFTYMYSTDTTLKNNTTRQGDVALSRVKYT
jgi:hypothetical protein